MLLFKTYGNGVELLPKTCNDLPTSNVLHTYDLVQQDVSIISVLLEYVGMDEAIQSCSGTALSRILLASRPLLSSDVSQAVVVIAQDTIDLNFIDL